MTIYAAGAVLWREEKGKLLVALIHRARREDWSFPKGKVDPGETFPEAAVREIYEETGLRIRLGVPLPTAHYKVPTGEEKEVHYWAARVSDKTLAKSKFKPSEEVEKVEWFTPAKAHELLSYKFDNRVLDYLVELEKKKQLRTNSLIVLRHAKAMPRSQWRNGRTVDDCKRPLIAEGAKQAKQLIPMLAAFGPKRVTSSPWLRCSNTVQPYAKKMNLPIIERSQLSENGNKKGPKRTRNVVKDTIDKNKSTLLCSHRPALPTILNEFSNLASKDHAKEIEAAADLKPAEFVVIHLAASNDKKRKKVVAVERWGLL